MDVKATREQMKHAGDAVVHLEESTELTLRWHNATQHFQVSHLSSPLTFLGISALSSLTFEGSSHVPWVI